MRTSARRLAEGNLLTPIAKAFSTDAGIEVASLGVQVHGGMGFIGKPEPRSIIATRASARR